MIYGNVNVDMNPDGLGAWEDIPTHVQVAGRYTIDDVQALLAKADTGLATSGLPVTYERDQIQTGNLIKKNYQDCLIVKICLCNPYNREYDNNQRLSQWQKPTDCQEKCR